MEFHQGSGDWQPETGTLMSAGQVVRDLLEGLEDFFNLLCRDPNPRITNRKHQITVLAPHRAYPYPALWVGKLHGMLTLE
jgi:hypothetical protein